ncbi:MAG: electron transport complex subunit RsxC [Oscillospiraceae bacterium]|nr:electron transport complex subunit RsxC [Oscillospiraceae bacterium]
MALSFVGGVCLETRKNARKTPIEILPAPEIVNIPTLQHTGVPAEPIVQAGDIVDKGQLIAVCPDNDVLSCPVHAGISGKVISAEREVITLENDYENRVHNSVRPFTKRINDTSPEQITAVIKNAGISGMGGASYPAYAKIQAAFGKVSTLIINGAECEPYITADHRLMLEEPELIINGMKILLKALGLKKGCIAVEDNKLNAAEAMTAAAGKSKMVEIKILKTKYPQGDERRLIKAITGKEIPPERSTIDFGCIVFNAGTCAAVCRAFTEGSPLTERIVTVDGDCIISPKNLKVPLGTPVSELIKYCGLKREPRKVIIGGAMTGVSADKINIPVIKSTAAVLVFSERKINRRSFECIRCGKCAERCPMYLMPLYLALFSQKEDMVSCKKYNVGSCMECGCCQYGCPANVPIVQLIKTAKKYISENRIDEEQLFYE